MSDESILSAAATIFAGMMASGKVNSNNDGNAKKYAYAAAHQFATAAETKNITGLADIAKGEVPFPW